ncbi:PPA1309 family protein [Kribbella sp. NPDC051770]|uniref:PPA1309 family protein n=1 Tax=Kribbella sp. NPDC051770 TaxID=3155413 RepID=UPI003430D5F7
MHAIDNLPADALSRAVVEIEKHVSSAGWDQPAQLFALVPTKELLAAEPQLAAELGADDAAQPLTPVAQGELPGGVEDGDLAEVLGQIEWPEGVSGCALAIERVVLPASVESGLPDAESDAELARMAASDPRRHEVRMVAAVLRDGQQFGAVRLRTHDEDSAVLTGSDLVPTLCQVLSLTFEPSSGEEQ